MGKSLSLLLSFPLSLILSVSSMSPDVEWRIGEEAEQETVVAAIPHQAVHWRIAWVALAVCLGVGLGVAYRSVPEPSPRPTPPPVATRLALPPNPPPAIDPTSTLDDPSVRFHLLEATLEREVNALADGDRNAFAAVQDQIDRNWLDAQLEDFQAWGRPAADSSRVFYFANIVPDSTSHQASIDIRQFRQNVYFRETRFYRWQTDRWVRTRAVSTLWCCDLREFTTPHFHLQIFDFDSNFARAILDRFETVYAQLCADLACAAAESASPINLIVKPELDHSGLELGSQASIFLPSPRIIGLRESASDFDRDDPLTSIALRRLPEIVARLAAGGSGRWINSQQGVLFLIAVAQWEQNRRQLTSRVEDLIQPDLIQGRKLTLPKYLWDWPVRDSRRLASPQAQANSVVVYIDQNFGPYGVVRFLKALGAAPSLPAAIEGSLPIGYNVFEQQWQTWLAKQLSN